MTAGGRGGPRLVGRGGGMSGPACAWCDKPATTRTRLNWSACEHHGAEDARLAEAVRKSADALAEAEAEARQATAPIIRYAELDDGTTEFDEFVAHNATVHFEVMGEAQFWIGVTLTDGRSWAINCGAKSARAKGFAICEED